MRDKRINWALPYGVTHANILRRRNAWLKFVFIVTSILILTIIWISPNDGDHQYFSGIRQASFPFKADTKPPLSLICTTKRDSRDRFACQAEASLDEFEKWQRSQSTTLAQAKRRYQKRYKRPPPRWFEDWYEFCKANDVRIIDDYDQLELDLKPFRVGSIDKSRILRAMEHVANGEGAYDGKRFISYLKIRDGKIDIKLPWAPLVLKGLTMLIDPVKHLLLDLDILVNWGDEPLVRGPELDFILTEDLPPVRYIQTAESIAEFDTKPCPISGILDTQVIQRLLFKPRHNPCEPRDLLTLKERHGKFQHPGREYNVTFPLLSTAKMAQHQDILFPMRGDVYGLLDGRIDNISWEQKADSLFWRGSTSGQENTDRNWNTSHRSRFVFDTQEWNYTMAQLAVLEPRQKSKFKRQILQSELLKDRDLSESGLEALSRLPLNTFNVSFTNFIFCRQKGCEKIAEKSPKSPFIPEITKWNHKFVFDIDGLGMSERFYTLLRSNSVVLKQTEWAEWHDEYLIPWVHFIPVTLSLDELPELLDFLINDNRGKEIARRIAEDSKKWVESALSVKAQSAFMLRLLNEYSDVMYGVKN